MIEFIAVAANAIWIAAMSTGHGSLELTEAVLTINVAILVGCVTYDIWRRLTSS
jgi:hypothetical protein